MKNIQYIIDNNGYKQSVILPINEYRLTKKNLVNQLTLSLMDLSFEYLKVPIDKKSAGRDASAFLKSIVKSPKYVDEIKENNFEIDLLDNQIALIQNVHQKVVQTQRNKFLIPAIESQKVKAVIHILDEDQDKVLKYRLNFFEAINNAVEEFLKSSSINFVEMQNTIILSERIKLGEVEKANDIFKSLFRVLMSHLSNLPNEMINNRSNQAQASREYQERLNSNG